MPRPSKYSPELRERAVRLVQEHAYEHPSQWAAMRSVAGKLGCTVEAPSPLGSPGGARSGEAPGPDDRRAPAAHRTPARELRN